MTIGEALRQASALLEDAGVGAPRLTAEVLLAHTLGRDRAWLFAHSTDALATGAWLHYGLHVKERLAGKPTQYITGVQEFYGREFRVSPDVLIPRPETEHVVERALALAKGATIADIGCGSGAIGVTLALETGCRAILTDVSDKAIVVARGNALRLGARVDLVQGDLVSMMARASVDLLVSNPPYVPSGDELPREVGEHEPGLALFAGVSGDDVYQRLFEDAPRVVKPGGWMVLELGWRSADAVRAFAKEAWMEVEVLPDLAGRDRVFVGRRR